MGVDGPWASMKDGWRRWSREVLRVFLEGKIVASRIA